MITATYAWGKMNLTCENVSSREEERKCQSTAEAAKPCRKIIEASCFNFAGTMRVLNMSRASSDAKCWSNLQQKRSVYVADEFWLSSSLSSLVRCALIRNSTAGIRTMSNYLLYHSTIQALTISTSSRCIFSISFGSCPARPFSSQWWTPWQSI